MPLLPRLVRDLALLLWIPAAIAWYAAVEFLPLPASELAPLRRVLAAGYIALAAILMIVAARLTGPLRRVLAHGAEPRPSATSVAALSGHRMPGRLAFTALLVSGVYLGLLVGAGMSRGLPSDALLAGLAIGTASTILSAMLAHAAATNALAPVLERLAAIAEPREKGSVRGKILWLGLGMATAGLLFFAATSYGRYCSDAEAEYLGAAARAQASALAVSERRPATSAAELVHLATGAPTALVSPGGVILARSGAPADVLLPNAGPLGAERVPGGWLMRRQAGQNRLVTYLSDEPLEDRREAFWDSLLRFALALFAAAVVLVGVASRSITLPLGALGKAANRIASGDLTVSPPIVSRDEIGRLAADFRRMTHGLGALVADVKGESQGVSEGARELVDIGDRVRGGALAQHEGAVAVKGAVEAMQGSIAVVAQGVGGLCEYAGSTSASVNEMAIALDELRREGTELERAMETAMADVDDLAHAGRNAQQALVQLDALAGHAGGTLEAVTASLSGLEGAAVSGQLATAEAARLADRAGDVVEETVRGIEALREAVGDAERRVTSLGRRAGDIDQIVDFIAEVAGRTNLLSLNASIIAAQAGEHGKAFAVVADQIRDLASQIASSTKSIADIIRALRDDVQGTASLIEKGDTLASAGVRLARNSAEALDQIRAATVQGHETAAAIQAAVQAHAQCSNEVAALVGSIADGSKTVGEAVKLVGGSVLAVGDMSGGVTAMADRVNRALEEQSRRGRQQLENLERLNQRIAGITQAVEEHHAATRRVHESLRHLGRSAEEHERAVEELAALAERLEGRARALAERVGKFKIW